MSEPTLDKSQIQQVYSEAISVLFGGAITAEPEQITEQVIQAVDTMLNEIAVCSRLVSNVSFNVLYAILLSPMVGAVVDKVLDPYHVNFLQKMAIKYTANKTVKTVLQEWVNHLSANRRFIGCINQARANWRSKIQIELMDL